MIGLNAMDSRAYLHTLDEDDLVELVLGLAARHPAVARELEERAAASQPDEWPGAEWDDKAFTALRGAVYANDMLAAFRVLAGKSLEPVLQVAGDVIIAALAAGTPGAAELASRCLALLRDRQMEGDHELIEQLAAVAEGAPKPLNAVPVDLEELAGELEGNDYRDIYIDLQAGDFYAGESLTGEPRPDPDDEDRWLHIGSQIGSRAGYEDMLHFTELVPDGRLRDRLERALEGKGAFRRFRDELHRTSGEVLDRWHLFSYERSRGRARAWLAERSLRPCWPAASTDRGRQR
jgi:hypothetical protein